jgi:hypothetical protein
MTFVRAAIGLSAVLLLSSTMAADKRPRASDLQVFRVHVRIDIDATGHVTQASPVQEIHPLVAKGLVDEVGRWRFQSPLNAGRAVTGSTVVLVRGCAVAEGDQLRLAFDHIGTGPYREGPPPMYPPDAARGGVGGVFDVIYRVEPDGSATVEELTQREGRASALKALRPAIEMWVTNGKYAPEVLDGRPVATRIQRTVEFVPPGGRVKRRSESIREKRSTQACQLAMEENSPSTEVVLDSPFVLVPNT